jgi:D-xylose transport system ATP-binding protein
VNAQGTAGRPDTPAVLELRQISKHFGGVHALSRVSLSIRRGEVVAVVGDNGAGKSTLFSVISGVLAPDEGEILFEGEPVTFTGPGEPAALGIQTVYQDLALCDNLDTVKNLFLGREQRAPLWLGRRLARSAMEHRAVILLGEFDVKLKSLRTPVGRLSGGQRQSIAVGRAVLADPSVVLLDEPTAALGIAQRRQVLSLIDRLRSQNRGIAVISHHLEDVRAVADRVVVLRLGRQVAEFERGSFTSEELLSAITGFSDYETPETSE